MKRYFTKLVGTECDFLFYTKSGSYGMYCKQIRHYWFCIPFIIGFRYTIEWGYDY